MVNYFNLLQETENNEDKENYEILYRQSCRNVSCEIYVYIEKINDILLPIVKQILRINKINKWHFCDKLKIACQKVPYGTKFAEVIDEYRENKSVKAIRTLRNDEVHNESILMINYNDNAQFNHCLYDSILCCLQETARVKEEFQKFIAIHYSQFLF